MTAVRFRDTGAPAAKDWPPASTGAIVAVVCGAVGFAILDPPTVHRVLGALGFAAVGFAAPYVTNRLATTKDALWDTLIHGVPVGDDVDRSTRDGLARIRGRDFRTVRRIAVAEGGVVLTRVWMAVPRRMDIAWSRVAALEVDGRSLTIELVDRGRIRLQCDPRGLEDALRRADVDIR